MGGGLLYSAVTDTCGMAALLARLPHNRALTCNVDDVLGRISGEAGTLAR